MGSALFIAWRESVEANLVLAILFAWIRRGLTPGVGLRHLAHGALAGVVLAFAAYWSVALWWQRRISSWA